MQFDAQFKVHYFRHVFWLIWHIWHHFLRVFLEITFRFLKNIFTREDKNRGWYLVLIHPTLGLVTYTGSFDIGYIIFCHSTLILIHLSLSSSILVSVRFGYLLYYILWTAISYSPKPSVHPILFFQYGYWSWIIWDYFSFTLEYFLDKSAINDVRRIFGTFKASITLILRFRLVKVLKIFSERVSVAFILK